MAKLARAVFVRDPDKHQDVLLRAGETPAPQYAVLVTNSACWEGGKLPAAVRKHLAGNNEEGGQGNGGVADQDDASGGARDGSADAQSDDKEPTAGGDSEDTKPAAARKATARKPARGRTTADEGTGGQ